MILIRTQRLTLRKLEKRDAKSYYNISKIGDNALFAYACFFVSETIPDAEKRIALYNSSATASLYGVWHKKTLVGAFLFEMYTNEILICSYFTGYKYRKRGYCLEALEGFLKHPMVLSSDFRPSFNLKALRFSVHRLNYSSNLIQEKIGSKIIGYSSLGEYLRYEKEVQD